MTRFLSRFYCGEPIAFAEVVETTTPPDLQPDYVVSWHPEDAAPPDAVPLEVRTGVAGYYVRKVER